MNNKDNARRINLSIQTNFADLEMRTIAAVLAGEKVVIVSSDKRAATVILEHIKIMYGNSDIKNPAGLLVYKDEPVPITCDEDTTPRNRNERRRGRKPDKPIWQKERR